MVSEQGEIEEVLVLANPSRAKHLSEHKAKLLTENRLGSSKFYFSKTNLDVRLSKRHLNEFYILRRSV